MTSFSVVTYVRESREIIEQFVAYYSALDAQEILIFTDGDANHLKAIEYPGLKITQCDGAFWSGQPGGKPAALEDAQSAIFMVGYRAAASDWVLIVDADEFVFGNLAMSDFLSRLPISTDVAVLPTAEAIWGPGDTDKYRDFSSSYFRLAIPRFATPLSRLIYGRTSSLLRKGLLGHTRGKQLIRANLKFDAICNHRTIRNGIRLGDDVAKLDPAFGQMYVGHFDATGLDRWQQKWQLRLSGKTNATNMSNKRAKQMELVGNARTAGPAAIRKLFLALFSINRFQWLVLRGLGLAFRRDLFSNLPHLRGLNE